MTSDIPIVQIARVTRNYQALRPLRIASLSIRHGERVAISGVDAAAAEVLVNLITGAALPDEGEVRVFGRSTAEISNGEEWLASLDKYGIVSPRAVLMEGATIEQNLAMPFTLEIEPVPPGVAAQVETLAVECGISAGAGNAANWLRALAGEAPHEVRARVHFARALALNPALLLLEHPTAGMEEAATARLGDDIARVLEVRKLTTIVITQDDSFASRVAHRTLKLQPATGELKPQRRGWFW
jgi:ABC-type transporter Mla maintaining outer membrane lipid asymmetry ATPase subunit MlaF